MHAAPGRMSSPRWMKVRRFARWALPIVVVIEIVLVLSGVMDVTTAAVVVVALELTVAALVVSQVFALRSVVKQARSEGRSVYKVITSSLDEVMPSFAARLIRNDLSTFRALYLAIRRRKDIATGAVPIEYSAQLKPKFWVFFALFPAEIVAVHFITPWAPVQAILFIVGVISAVWFAGLVATLYVYPHSVDERELRLRWATFQDHTVPSEKIGTVRRIKKSWDLGLRGNVVDDVLVMETENETNLLIELTNPVSIDMGRRGRRSVCTVALWADDPAAAVAAIRAQVPGDAAA